MSTSSPPGSHDSTLGVREQILSFPWPLWDYLSWQKARQGDTVGRSNILTLFKPSMRFEARDADLLELEPGARVTAEEGGAVVACDERTTTLTDLDVEVANRLLKRIDGRRMAVDVVGSPRVLGEPEWPVLDRLLGWVVTAPEAFLALESKVSGAMTARFPSSPYGIERNYWQNMGDIWARREPIAAALEEPRRFDSLLRDLHVVAVMGANLDSFYKPASLVSDTRVRPGAYDALPTFVGGYRSPYFFILSGVHDDPVIFSDLYEHKNDDGLVFATVRRVEKYGAMLFPVRPVSQAHVLHLGEVLAAAQAAAARGEREAAITLLADFHQLFVLLHPFACANQCIAMALVNQILVASLGGGMPHVHLDNIALVASRQMYRRVFADAVRIYTFPSGADPYALTRTKAARANTFLAELFKLKSPADAHQLIAQDPEGAALTLLSPPH